MGLCKVALKRERRVVCSIQATSTKKQTMTLGELLIKEGLTLSNHDRNRIGLLIGAKAKELSITKTQKAESNGDKHYNANDYPEAFAGDMMAIVREFIANPPVVVEKAKFPEGKHTAPPKKVKEIRVLPVAPTKNFKIEDKELAAFEGREIPQPAKKTRQQEWLEKRRKEK